MARITDEMKAFIEGQKVSFVATSSKKGKPNVSPKGTVRVVDDKTLAFCDLFSRKTHRNLQENPWVAVSVVDEDELKGYQFVGPSEEIEEGPLFEWMEKEIAVPGKWKPTIKRVIKINVKEIHDLAPPGEYYLE